MSNEEIKLSDSMLEAMQNADGIAMKEMISVSDVGDDGNVIGQAQTLGVHPHEDDHDNLAVPSNHDEMKDARTRPESQISLGSKGMRYYHNAKQMGKDDNDNFYYLVPDSKRILFLEFKIKRISNIDTSEETFRCSFHFYVTWLATFEDYKLFSTLKSQKKHKDYIPYWVPKISLTNVVDVHNSDSKIKYYIRDAISSPGSISESEWAFGHLSQKFFGFPPWEGRWNRCKYSFEATFAEQFEFRVTSYFSLFVGVFNSVFCAVVRNTNEKTLSFVCETARAYNLLKFNKQF